MALKFLEQSPALGGRLGLGQLTSQLGAGALGLQQLGELFERQPEQVPQAHDLRDPLDVGLGVQPMLALGPLVLGRLFDTLGRRVMIAFTYGVSGVLLALSPAKSQQADYPNRPIKIIVCLPPGGGVDTVTRIISERLQRRLGQTIVIENKGGQSGNIGAEAVFTAEPDGYTLLASQPAPITTNPLLYKSVTFDPAASMAEA